VRGLLRETGGRLQLMPCDGGPLVLEDRTPDRELSRVLRELTAAQEGRPMFVELSAQRDFGLGGVAAVEVRRAAVDTPGCRERFDQREWLALGSEPAWRLEVTARDLMLNVPGVSALPVARIPHGGARLSDGRIAYAATDGSDFAVTIHQRRCVDSATGAWFAYYVEIESEGKSLAGCAAHNPAMPAP
jgi:uncharacterized membrane protein